MTGMTGWDKALSASKDICGYAGALILASLLVAGCSSGNGMARVEGTVMLGGQPLEGATVEFLPADGQGAPASGHTDDRGRYELMYTYDTAGIPPGEYIVSIRTAETFFDDQGNEREREERVPPGYNARTELKRTVEPGGNTIDFDL